MNRYESPAIKSLSLSKLGVKLRMDEWKHDSAHLLETVAVMLKEWNRVVMVGENPPAKAWVRGIREFN